MGSEIPEAAEHVAPAFVGQLPPCDPVWEATRPDRSAVTHWVEYDLPRIKGDPVVMSNSVPCYNELEAQRVKQSLRVRGMRNIQLYTAAEKRGLLS